MLGTWVRQTVPSGGDVVSEGRSRADLSGQPQIADLDDVVIDEQVFGFHVAMEETVFVHSRKPTGDLIDHVSA